MITIPIGKSKKVWQTGYDNTHGPSYFNAFCGNIKIADMTIVITNDYARSSTKAAARNQCGRFNKVLLLQDMVKQPYDDMMAALAEEINIAEPKIIHITGPNVYELRQAVYGQEDSDLYIEELLTNVLTNESLSWTPDMIINSGNSGIEESVIKTCMKYQTSFRVMTNKRWMYKLEDGTDHSGDPDVFLQRFNPF